MITFLTLTDLGYTWAPHPVPGVANRLRSILESWEDTPYMAGQCVKKEGVDCVRFNHATLAEAYRVPMVPLIRLPQDLAMHNRKGAMRAMRQMRKCWPNHDRYRGHVLRPGMVIVTGWSLSQTAGGPGHCIMVGPDQNTLWQAGTIGVGRYGWGFAEEWQQIYRVYEFRDTHLWQ